MNELLDEKNQENEDLRKTMNNLEIEINKMQIFEQEKQGIKF